MSRYDHVIVGGGVGGMTCALLLAMEGKSVALVEAGPALAPTIGGFKRRGVYFDTGLHYLGGLGDGDPLDVYFSHLGVGPLIEKKELDQTGFDRVVFGDSGQSVDYCCGFDAMSETLSKQFPDERSCIEKYFSVLENKVMSTPFLNFERDFDMNYLMDDSGGWETVDEFLSEHTSDDRLKKFLSIHCLLYGTNPSEATMATHGLVAGSYLLSAHTIKGGGKALVRAYASRLKELGVDCFTGSPVTQIRITEERQVEAVELANGTVLETPACIWTGHPAKLADVTPAHAFRPAFRKRLGLLKDSGAAIILFGIAEKEIPALNGRNLFLLPDGSESSPFDPTRLMDDGIYLSASRDKSGKVAVTAIASQDCADYDLWKGSDLRTRPEEYKTEKARRMATLEREIYKRMPELEGEIDFIEGATPLTIRDYCHTPTGSLYGAIQSVSQFNPAPVTKVAGLTLAGQSLIVPGILGTIVSAYVTTGIIVGHEKLHNALRQFA